MKHEREPYPKTLDKRFFHELMYIKHENEIEKYKQEQDKFKTARLQKAKQENHLLECPCCYDNELIKEDMLACPLGHYYCK